MAVAVWGSNFHYKIGFANNLTRYTPSPHVPNNRFIHETTSDFQAAVGRIERLKDATEAELRHHNDVCAICYADMQVSVLAWAS